MVTEAEVVGSTMSQTAEASGTVQREKREVAKIKRLTWQTVLLIAEIEKEVGESNITAVVEGEGTQGVQEDERARYEIPSRTPWPPGRRNHRSDHQNQCNTLL
jgi:predicted transcriptional regulator